MGRFFAALLIFSGVILTIDLGVPLRAAAGVATGSLYLSTLPSGADVWLDGAYVGTSPVLVDALAVGHHSLSVTKAGWAVKEMQIDINERDTAMESLRLERGTAHVVRSTGTLAIRGTTGDLHAWIDGVALGSAAGAAAIVRAGTHSLVVETARGRMTRRVTIYPDMTTNVVLRDAPEVHAPSVLTAIDEALPDAAVSIEKKSISIKYGGHHVSAVVGSEKMLVDGVPLLVDVAPTMIAGRLYVPQALVKKLSTQSSKAATHG